MQSFFNVLGYCNIQITKCQFDCHRKPMYCHFVHSPQQCRDTILKAPVNSLVINCLELESRLCLKILARLCKTTEHIPKPWKLSLKNILMS